jgi:sigma-B regulation protein RsbU (phosphoserine phosphatase)
MVQALGRAISRSAPSNRYATLLFLDLDYATHRLRYINAGHAPLPLHVQPSGTVHELPAGGTPLGLFPEFEYADDELQLGPGDLVFACTDGVTDLENPEGEMYGEERLRELLRSVARRTPAEIRRVLDASLEEFAGGNRRPDDLSYILVRRDD